MLLQYLLPTFAILAATNAQNTTAESWNFNCSIISPDTRSNNQSALAFNYTISSPTTHRVSAAVSCPSNATRGDAACRLRALGSLTIEATTNATEINDTSVVRPLIERGLASAGYEVTNITTELRDVMFQGQDTDFFLDPGVSAYLGFTPAMRCFNGTVQAMPNCEETGDDIERTQESFEGRGLSICVPFTEKETGSGEMQDRIVGTLSSVEIDADEADEEGMDSNPADPEGDANQDGNDQDGGEDGEDDGEDDTSTSARLHGGMEGVIIGGLTALLVGGMM